MPTFPLLTASLLQATAILADPGGGQTENVLCGIKQNTITKRQPKDHDRQKGTAEGGDNWAQ